MSSSRSLTFVEKLTASHRSPARLTLCDSSLDLVTYRVTSPTSDAAFHFLNLHRNENTSIVAARAFVAARGGAVSWLDTVPPALANARLVSFSCMGTQFSFDPNRIFTSKGAAASLTMYSSGNAPPAPVLKAVLDFGQALLSAYGFDSLPFVVAIHNNGPGYSIADYQPGGQFAGDAAQLNVADNATLRNFFLVTRVSSYAALVAAQQNVVLQASNATDDGSLSYYAAKMNRNYLNIEGAAANSSDGSEVAAQVAQLVAMSNELLGVPGFCSNWQTGTIVLGLVALLLGGTLLVIGLSIWRQRRKAEGYTAIERQNLH